MFLYTTGFKPSISLLRLRKGVSIVDQTKTEPVVSKQMALYQFGGRSLEWCRRVPLPLIG